MRTAWTSKELIDRIASNAARETQDSLKNQRPRDVDNRDMDAIEQERNARIDVLRTRIRELEAELADEKQKSRAMAEALDRLRGPLGV